jgi:hypothetical protein
MRGVKACHILFYVPPVALLQGVIFIQFYSDFRVVTEICPDLFSSLQYNHDPGYSCSQLLIIWSKMPRVEAQPPKRNPALCHIKFWKHAQKRWANYLFVLLYFVPNVAQYQPCPFNGPFWNNMGYLYDSQVSPL